MSNLLSKTACPQCSKTGMGTSLGVYDDGSYCFECGYRDSNEDVMEEVQNNDVSGLVQGTYPDILRGRGITREILEKFEYQRGTYTGKIGDDFVTNEPIDIANIRDRSGNLCAQQLRASNKRFKIVGPVTKDLGLSGTHLYNSNQNVFVTIVEGYIDQLSVAQACGSQFPVVTVPAGTGSGVKAILKDLDWLQGFKYVVLAFDNDEAGKKLTQDVLPLFSPGKVRVAAWPEKDANDLVKAGRLQEVKQILFNAIEHRPDGLKELSDFTKEDLLKLVAKGTPLPFPILNEKLGGLFPSSLYSFVAEVKSGKTLLTKEIVLSLLSQGKTVGLFYLEEEAGRAVTSLVAMDNNVATWKIREDYEPLGGVDNVLQEMSKFKGNGSYIYDHKGVNDFETLLNRMQYLSKAKNIDYIILDNASLAIAGFSGANEPQAIANFVSGCVSITQDSSTSIISVSHLKKNREVDIEEGESKPITLADIYGSGSIAKHSYTIVALEGVKGRDEVKLSILADRGRNRKGYADTLSYSDSTGRLTPKEMPI